MSIHALFPCPGCKLRFAFPEQHWPHCPGNPNNLTGAVKVSIEKLFSKSELAQIASHGPVADKPIRSKKPRR